MNEENKLYKIIVEGVVQGVGFRAMTRHFAKKNSLIGDIKNNMDGNVEIIIYGNDVGLKLIERFCESSPGISEVSSVKSYEIRDSMLKQKYKNKLNFEILR